AEALGDRVARVVLVDGGLPPKLPAVLSRPWAVRAAFGLALKRSAKQWKDVDSYARVLLGKSLRSRPDLLPEITQWCAYDLDADRRPRLERTTIVADAVDCFFGPDVEPALRALTVPTHLVWATDGKHDGARPMYTQEVVESWLAQLPHLRAYRVPANHVTVMFSPEVARAVALSDA
ncbi:MAG: alpha/beta hydrolase, partial [Actinomycetota bacterium]|nr:alpha/beta hydrolase [Actinomycetota bacterium]